MENSIDDEINKFKMFLNDSETIAAKGKGKKKVNDETIRQMYANQWGIAQYLIAGLFIGLFLMILFSCVVVVNTGYVGVKHEFGEAKTILNPGIHFLVPFKDSVQLMNMQVLKYSVPSSSVSKDLQMVTTTITVNYRIKPKSSLDIWTNFRGSHEERIVEPLTHETLKAVSSQYTASELIQKRDVVKDVVTIKLQEKLNEYDLDVVEVSLVDFQFSEVFDKAIEEKMVAEQEKLKMQQELEKTQIEVQKLIAQADAQSESKKLVADASAYQKRAEADAEAYYLLTTSQEQAAAINRIKSTLSGDYLNYWYIENWNGELPRVTSSAGVLLSMNMSG